MNPLLIDLPPFIETQRLCLQPPRPSDIETVYQSLQSSYSEISQFISWADRSHEDLEMMLRTARAKWYSREWLMFLIWDRKCETFIGNIDLHGIDWNIPKFEIGYWLDSRQTGVGYMTEAVNGVVEFARTYFHALRIEIWCDVQNTRSAEVARRAGFESFVTWMNRTRNWKGALCDHTGFCKTWPD